MVYHEYDLLIRSKNPGAPLSGGILLPRAGTRPGARSAEGFSRPTSQVSLTLNLLGQEPLGSLQNSHFASQNRASCGLPLSHPYHRTGPEKTPLKTPVSERSERIGVFPVLPGHGPRSAPQRRDFIAPRGHAPRPRAYGLYTTPSSAVHRRVPYFSSISWAASWLSQTKSRDS